MQIEDVMQEIIGICKRNGATTVILFGSRAKGTALERSDIDIAVSGGNFEGFYLDIKEKTYSLLSFDIVDLGPGVSDELMRAIETEGVVIYEKAR